MPDDDPHKFKVGQRAATTAAFKLADYESELLVAAAGDSRMTIAVAAHGSLTRPISPAVSVRLTACLPANGARYVLPPLTPGTLTLLRTRVVPPQHVYFTA